MPQIRSQIKCPKKDLTEKTCLKRGLEQTAQYIDQITKSLRMRYIG